MSSPAKTLLQDLQESCTNLALMHGKCPFSCPNLGHGMHEHSCAIQCKIATDSTLSHTFLVQCMGENTLCNKNILISCDIWILQVQDSVARKEQRVRTLHSCS